MGEIAFGGSHQIVDQPGLAAHLGCDPSGFYRDKTEGVNDQQGPEKRPVLIQRFLSSREERPMP